MQQLLIGVPLKAFGVAKRRLHPRLGADARSRLGKRIAAQTLATARAGGEVVVISGDADVTRWANALGYEVVEECGDDGLNGAARALGDAAVRAGRPWAVLHADLPLLGGADMVAFLAALRTNGAAIAPSYDGGTSALAASEKINFSYGVGSFRRHLELVPHAGVVVRPGLAYDLDTVADFDRIAASPDGAWLLDTVAIDSPP